MRYLLDTHVFSWTGWEPHRVSSQVQSEIRSPTNEIFVSVVTLWEICIKSGLGKFAMPASMIRKPADGFREALRSASFHILPIDLDHAAAVRDLPLHHRDPFDRMLIAQTTHEGLTLVTHDDVFDRYAGLRTLKT